MRVARLGFAVVTAAWVVLLATAPSTALGVPLSGAVYAFSSLICHQRPERSFHIGLAQVPVCARCYGLYLGAAIGAIAALNRAASESALKGRPTSPWPMWRGASVLRRFRLALMLAALPTALTWVSEVAGLWQPANVTRFIAALPLGTAVALTVNYVECARPPRLGSRPPRTPI